MSVSWGGMGCEVRWVDGLHSVFVTVLLTTALSTKALNPSPSVVLITPQLLIPTTVSRLRSRGSWKSFFTGLG